MKTSILDDNTLSSPIITTADRQWSVTDVRVLSQLIVTAVDGCFLNSSSESARILIPTDEPAHFLAALVACYELDCTAIPYSEDAGKGLSVLQPLLDPDAILDIIDGCPAIRLLNENVHLKARLGDVILTTTGSTGFPKGVCLNFDQLVLNALSAGAEIGLSAGTRWAIETDLALTSGLCHLLMAWLCGANFRHLRNDSDIDKKAWMSEAPFGYGGAPIQLSNLADLAGDISSPIMLMSSGDFLTSAVVKKIRSVFPQVGIHKFYGLTEVAGRFCALPATMIDENPDATGFPLKGTSLAIFRDNGESVDVGERGAIFLRSSLLMNGYIYIDGRFEATSANQWFATGDEGMLNSKGLLTLMGRTNFSFKVGGEKVDAYTIEQSLTELFEECSYCVVPIPHDVLGQCAALFVENSDDTQELFWQRAVSIVAKSLPSRYVPMFGYVVEEFPRLPNGKLDRMALIKSFDDYEKLK